MTAGHNIRLRQKVIDYINGLPAGTTFTTRDITEAMNKEGGNQTIAKLIQSHPSVSNAGRPPGYRGVCLWIVE